MTRIGISLLLVTWIGCSNVLAAPSLDYHKQDYYAPAHYSFEYGVHDPHTGDIKSQKETRHGDKVTGYYKLKEADGTTRIVHYVADDHSGFNAEVTKIGHAVHDDHHGYNDVATISHHAPLLVPHHDLNEHHEHHVDHHYYHAEPKHEYLIKEHHHDDYHHDEHHHDEHQHDEHHHDEHHHDEHHHDEHHHQEVKIVYAKDEHGKIHYYYYYPALHHLEEIHLDKYDHYDHHDKHHYKPFHYASSYQNYDQYKHGYH